MSIRRSKYWQRLYKIHRYLGLVSGIVLLMLAITGIILNHTDDLKLDSRFVKNQTLLNWYGIFSPNPQRVFNTNNHYFSQFDQSLYFNQGFILKTSDVLQGAIETKNFIVLAFNNSMVLLSFDGEIIEQIKKLNLKRIGINANQHIFIQQAQQILISTDDLLSWKKSDLNHIQWSQASTLPMPLETTIKHNFRGHILPLERLFLDLHSGRFFGKIGVLIVDVCGGLLILLVLSGVGIWLRHSLFRRRRNN
ncbi:MAG: PepSY domain-containing protein [Methylococcales bacterium]|nr:PepSY domain-containing protein [Methylococcales bacterium]